MFFGYYMNPLYFIIIAPAVILGLWAQWKTRSAFQAASKMIPASGTTGAEAAAVILRQAGLQNVEVVRTEGFLSDHYDPREKVLRLSPEVYDSKSLAALGVAAHEAGHALQDASGYAPLVLRNGIVPLASVGGGVCWILLAIGMMLHSFGLTLAGIIAFSVLVIFQLINLPVEFDASRRAKQLLQKIGLVKEEEAPAVRAVLSAAAMTYVAATLMAALQLLFFLIQAGIIGGRRSDDR
jgi:Zn-dependent membrane protease YugP